MIKMQLFQLLSASQDVWLQEIKGIKDPKIVAPEAQIFTWRRTILEM